MARVATLRKCAIHWPRCTVRVDLVGAVVLLVRLAVAAGQVGANLCTNTDTVADLDGLHIFADLDCLSDDLVADADGQRSLTPAAVDGVDVRSAYTAALDGNVNVAVLEGLELELGWLLARRHAVHQGALTNLLLLEGGPLLLVLNHEASGGLWVTHVCGSVVD